MIAPGSSCLLYTSLRELEKNMDGYQNSVRAVMRAAGARRLRGVLGPVSTILKVESGCEVAIETALGGALQNLSLIHIWRSRALKVFPIK